MKTEKDATNRLVKRSSETKLFRDNVVHPKQISNVSNGSGSAPTHLIRTISACFRCRSRKTKCDQKFPSCSSCQKAGVECVGLDAATGREIPRRFYVSHLEDRVAFLEIQLQNNGIPVDTTPILPHVRALADVENLSNDSLAAGPANSTTFSPSQDLSDNGVAIEKGVNSVVSTVGLVASSSNLSSLSFLGLSSGISFARLMFAAVKMRGQDLPSTAMSIASSEQPDMTLQRQQHSVQPAGLPSKEVAETLLETFFNQANAQIPIFHRDDFIKAYFEPVYGEYSSQVKLANLNDVRHNSASPASTGSTPLNSSSSSFSFFIKPEHSSEHDKDKSSEEKNAKSSTPELKRAYYFLHLMFAIGVAVHQQKYPVLLCESYHAAATKYAESAFASPNRLESLQGILLLALYSIMRPAVPGVWYVLGVALRLCVDLGLHVEGGVKTWSGSKNGKDETMIDARTLDLRRRLFWCTYAMDRQVCVYLGRPFGIPDNFIKVPFPCDLDDVFITFEGIATPPDSTPPSYKQVAVHIFQIRRLQSEIQTILYERAELPRRFSSLREWQTNMSIRLEEWHRSCPKSSKDMNCNFNLSFLDINFHQTRLLLHGICPAIPRPSIEAFFIIADASEKVIRAYQQLHGEKNINYTWMAVHTLFMAGTSYLYCLYHSKEVRSLTRMDAIDFHTMACIHVLTAMVDKCDAAAACRDTFELLTAAILRMCYNEKVASGEIVSTSQDLKSKSSQMTTPPVPPLVSPPAKRRKFTSDFSAQVDTPQNILKAFPGFEGMSNCISPTSTCSSAMDNSIPMPRSQVNADLVIGQDSSTQAVEPGLSPFASFESNTLQWMTNMEPDLDQIFKTVAEIQSVPPMYGNFTHPIAYSGNVSGNTQGGGYAYQFSPSSVIQSQFTLRDENGKPNGVVSPRSEATVFPVSNSATVTPQQHNLVFDNKSPSSVSMPVNAASQVSIDDEYDGQRIYEMMYELPSASIWEQFFAVPGNSAYAAFPAISGLGSLQNNSTPVQSSKLTNRAVSSETQYGARHN
ncbi:fungal-specific transcription factor domain-containing protein [Lipomyces japonicus]|uniref:fungal-specific transcription factor domain-containing protein n=1 Tax=Lipomyces japonicus TaxID=56871 RepID=UPI0034CE6CCB